MTKKILKNKIVNSKTETKIANTKKIEAKIAKKKEQNTRIWLSCESKGHFGCMVPKRYLDRAGVKEKLVCPVCGKPLKLKSEQEEEILAAANR